MLMQILHFFQKNGCIFWKDWMHFWNDYSTLLALNKNTFLNPKIPLVMNAKAISLKVMVLYQINSNLIEIRF